MEINLESIKDGSESKPYLMDFTEAPIQLKSSWMLAGCLN